MRKIGDAVTRFMYGRNGLDRLGRAMLWLYLALCVLRTAAVLLVRNRLLDTAFGGALWALAIVILYRMFSKDLYRRRAEDQKWADWTYRLRRSRQGALERHADKDHKYFTCKECRTVCRVPVGKGEIVITCPKCGAQIRART